MAFNVNYYDPPLSQLTVPSLPRATSSHAEDLVSIINVPTPLVVNPGSFYGGLVRAAPTLSMFPWLTGAVAKQSFRDNYFPRPNVSEEDQDSVTWAGKPQIPSYDYPIERQGKLGVNPPQSDPDYWERGFSVAKVPEKLNLYGPSFNVHRDPSYLEIRRSRHPYESFRDLRPPFNTKEMVNTLRPETGAGVVAKERIGRNKAAVDHLEKQIGKRSASHTILGNRRMKPMKNYFVKRALTQAAENRYKSAKANRKTLREKERVGPYRYRKELTDFD